MSTTDKGTSAPPAVLTALPRSARIRSGVAWARREHVGLSTPED